MENLYKLSDERLIENIQNHNEYSSESVEILSQRHGGLINNVYNKYVKYFCATGINLLDLKSESQTVLWKAAESYKSDKNSKFTSWLHNQINYQCLNAFNAHKKINDNEVKFDNFNRLEKEEDNIDINQIESIKEIIDSFEDKRIKTIFYLRYFEIEQKNRTNWREIGKKLDLSATMCINLHNKGLKIIKEKLNNNN